MGPKLIRLLVILATAIAIVPVAMGQTPPVGTPELQFEARKNPERVFWSPLEPGGTHFDLVRGSLTVLLASGGDFTQATEACLASDLGETAFDDFDRPAAGEGFWYVVRGTNSAGVGTYNDLAASQVGNRDAETNASAVSCP